MFEYCICGHLEDDEMDCECQYQVVDKAPEEDEQGDFGEEEYE